MSNRDIKRREMGKELILKSCALVDTCQRTRNLNEKSVLALASMKAIGFTVLMLSADKKNIYKKLLKQSMTKTRFLQSCIL